ncbi:hypothetical protein D3C71_2210930 [compost metagenome]
MVDFEWQNSQLKKGSILALNGGDCKVALPANMVLKDPQGRVVARTKDKAGVIGFSAAKGASYHFEHL